MNQPPEIDAYVTFCGARRSVVPPLDTLPESRHDMIGMIASKIASITTWTAKRAEMREHMERLAIAHGYVGAWLDYRDYHLNRVGQSYLYDVPPLQKGILRQFAGKRVRLVCVFSGKFRRWVRIGECVMDGAC